MNRRVSSSEFYMWRALFALVHADDVVTPEEVRYLAEIFEDVPFNEEQRILLNDDIHNPKDPAKMFAKITEVSDQQKFFRYARELVMVDGVYDKSEQDAIIALMRKYHENLDFDSLVGHAILMLEDDPRGQIQGQAEIKIGDPPPFQNSLKERIRGVILKFLQGI